MNSAEKDIILDNIVANREAAQRFMRNDYSGLRREQNLHRRIDRNALLKGVSTPSKITDAQLKAMIR